ncbi:dbp9 [Symbiodinium natans]|uniref:Dbp9 protein n=1 Tax=Symbiodinium natans TaxID=878477 RepID=A0A812PI41_9DINO|nr:dbp9 [Symbiodinium natans]
MAITGVGEGGGQAANQPAASNGHVQLRQGQLARVDPDVYPAATAAPAQEATKKHKPNREQDSWGATTANTYIHAALDALQSHNHTHAATSTNHSTAEATALAASRQHLRTALQAAEAGKEVARGGQKDEQLGAGEAEQELLIAASYPGHGQASHHLQQAQYHMEACLGAEASALEVQVGKALQAIDDWSTQLWGDDTPAGGPAEEGREENYDGGEDGALLHDRDNGTEEIAATCAGGETRVEGEGGELASHTSHAALDTTATGASSQTTRTDEAKMGGTTAATHKGGWANGTERCRQVEFLLRLCKRCQALLALPLDATLALPHPGEFARNRLWKGLTAADSKLAAQARHRRRLAARENCFPLGRFAEQQGLAREGCTRGICSATKLLPSILKDWKVLRRECGAATPCMRELRNCQEGVEEFLSDATMAIARLLRLSPAKIRQRVRQAVQRDWQVMRPQHQLLFAATAAQRALSRPPARGCEAALRVLRGPGPRLASSRPPSEDLREVLRRAPASSELYGQGSDATFSHPFVKELLREAQARVSWDNWVICVRTYARPENLMSQTMKLLRCAGLFELRDRVHVFCSHEDPDFLSGRYEEVLGQLRDRIIVGVKGADLQVRFIEECFLPGQHVVVMDDNLLRFVRHEAGEELPGDLVATIDGAAAALHRFRANLWGISPTSNKTFLKEAPEISTNLGLVYGAFFGFRVLHDPELYTRFGQVKDDLERTLRYWHRDGVLVRFRRMSCTKAQRPGVYSSKKGGISASVGAYGHKQQGDFALARLSKGFSQYIRLPSCEFDQKRDPTTGQLLFLSSKKPRWKEGSHVADCGVVWIRRKSPLLNSGPWASAPAGRSLSAGFCCKPCRGEADGQCTKCSCISPVQEEARQLFFAEGLEAVRALARLLGKPNNEKRATRALEREWHRLPPRQRGNMEALAARDFEQKQWCVLCPQAQDTLNSAAPDASDAILTTRTSQPKRRCQVHRPPKRARNGEWPESAKQRKRDSNIGCSL